MRANALDENERAVVAHLRAQHLPGVDTDDEAGVALEIEQARLLLFGAGGIILFISTQLLRISGAVCMRPIYFSIIFLLPALLCSWIILARAANFRRHRVERRYRMYHTELDVFLHAHRTETSPDQSSMNREWDALIGEENRKRRNLSWFRLVALSLASAGIACALWAVIATIQPSLCWGEPTIVKARNVAAAPIPDSEP